MAQSEDIISTSLCAMCGRGVYIDSKHGRITCRGCDQYTDCCFCDEVFSGSKLS